MAKKNKKGYKAEENLASVEEALSKTEQFIDKNKNTLLYSIGGIIVLVLAVMGYQRYILLPQEREAHEEMFKAEMHFERDSFELALYGDGAYLGFLDIIDEYGRTGSGNLAHYYAGMSYLHLGDYDAAIDHLKRFKSNDVLVRPMAYGGIAGAYMELGDLEQAARYYKRAADASDNMLTTPEFLFRLGLTYELLNRQEDALEAYETIKREYPESPHSQDIQKYISRAGTKHS